MLSSSEQNTNATSSESTAAATLLLKSQNSCGLPFPATSARVNASQFNHALIEVVKFLQNSRFPPPRSQRLRVSHSCSKSGGGSMAHIRIIRSIYQGIRKVTNSAPFVNSIRNVAPL